MAGVDSRTHYAPFHRAEKYPKHLSVDFKKIKSISLKKYADMFDLAVRADAQPHELAVAVARHFETHLEVDEDEVLARFMNAARRVAPVTANAMITEPVGVSRRIPKRPGGHDGDDGDDVDMGPNRSGRDRDEMTNSNAGGRIRRPNSTYDDDHPTGNQMGGAASMRSRMPHPSGDRYSGAADSPIRPGGVSSSNAATAAAVAAAAAKRRAMNVSQSGSGMGQGMTQPVARGGNNSIQRNTNAASASVPSSNANAGSSNVEGGEGGEDREIYCECHQEAYGEMIGCDNDACPVEWFHLECVGLTLATKPKGKWYCPSCRKQGGASNIARTTSGGGGGGYAVADEEEYRSGGGGGMMRQGGGNANMSGQRGYYGPPGMGGQGAMAGMKRPIGGMGGAIPGGPLKKPMGPGMSNGQISTRPLPLQSGPGGYPSMGPPANVARRPMGISAGPGYATTSGGNNPNNANQPSGRPMGIPMSNNGNNMNMGNSMNNTGGNVNMGPRPGMVPGPPVMRR